MYPIQPDREIDSLLASLLIGETNADGRALLAFNPTGQQRQQMALRRDFLAKHLAPMPDGGIARVVTEMLAGFGSARAGGDEPKMVVTQYVKELRGLPGWAIARACSRFAQGQVGPDEVEGVNRGFAPSTAQVHTVARRIAQPHREERHKLHQALTGIVEHKPTPEERQRVGALMRGLADSMKSSRAAEDAGRKTAGGAVMERANERFQRSECERAGVDPDLQVSPGLAAYAARARQEMERHAAQREAERDEREHPAE